MSINIKPSKVGTFTAISTKRHLSVHQFTAKVLSSPPGSYSPAMRKKAQFAENASHWNH